MAMSDDLFANITGEAAKATELSDRIGHLLIAQALRGNRQAASRFAAKIAQTNGEEEASTALAHVATVLIRTARGVVTALSDASPGGELVGISAIEISDNPDEALAFRMALCAVQGDYDSMYALMLQREGSQAELIAFQFGALAEINALFAKQLYDLNPDSAEPAWIPLLQQYQSPEVSSEVEEDLRRKISQAEVDPE